MAKYDGLRDYLRHRSGDVEMSFEEVSALVPGGLPSSAHRYSAWWTNEDRTHPQSRSWGDAGFSAHPDIARRRVRFERRS
ncbi:DUF7662 domain-containing protein [Micromonospora sp. CA-249363]|uniref:DUF7662 domain-containing protein n=1 Tax=Micromonospora sp. CA-249363 TaxID=3239963 RepID=UPI003D8BC04E